jgi:transposase
MMSINIFPARSQTATAILTDGRKVLIVPIDFAKNTHVVQLCLGTGEYLQRRPLNVHNTRAGAEYLLGKVEGACQKYRIRKADVIFGGEDPAEYVWNFVLLIQQAGYTFVRVNAREASIHRSNQRATSDKLALSGITQAILLRRSYDIKFQDEIFTAMKRASRSRRRLKRQETAVQNRIYKDMDVLLPGFLNEKMSGCLPFGAASLELMENGISVVRLRRMRLETLSRTLKKNHIQNPEEAARKLKELAATALEPQPAIVPYLEKTLAGKVNYLRCLRENIVMEENEMARCLAQTQGFLMTTIPGIGIVLGAGIVAEYGDPELWRCPNRMASYAGIVVRDYQTGGPDSPPVPCRMPRNANR